MTWKEQRTARVGEAKFMHCGLKATIIKYRRANDIDIQFEDGAIREHCAYKEFCEGYIKHPNDTPEGQAAKRIGEKRYMNCGLEATIVEYNSSHDITIQFSDGSVSTNKDYSCFLDGSIAHPKTKSSFGSLQETAVGFYLLKFGFIKTSKGDLQHLGFGQMELDFYHPDKKIAVEVDGEVHKLRNQYARDIRKNKMCKDNGIKLYRLRDKTLPAIENSTSIDYVLNGRQIMNGFIDCKKELDQILFENGFKINSNTIDYDRDFKQIMKTHHTKFINYWKRKRVGEKSFHKVTNQYMTIIDYKDYHHVTIRFDDGFIIKNKNYGAFKRGEIQHEIDSPDTQKCERLGETRKMNNGMITTLIAYRNAEDIDVQFEDGTIIENITYYNWTQGFVKNPNLPNQNALISRIGESNVMNCGKRATIIAYKNQNNIDIQFDDGVIVKSKKYSRFKDGGIAYPTDYAKLYMGETRTMKCGLQCTIVRYKNSKDIDVKFEDGRVVKTNYQHFKNCSILPH